MCKFAPPNPPAPKMITPGSTDETSKFSVSKRPVVARIDRSTGETDHLDYEDLGELPRSYSSSPLLYLISRDPRTLFAYWDIDWTKVFGEAAPVERKVTLRVFAADDVEDANVVVEPMAGNSYVTVSNPAVTYRAEIGYYEPAKVWNSLAASGPVTTPAEGFTEPTPVDVATVPIHLSFQRIIDSFREAKQVGESLTEMLARLRKRAADAAQQEDLTSGEKTLLRAFDFTAAESQERDLEKSAYDLRMQKKLERILGFGAGPAGSSPTNGFTGSSRG